MNYKIITSTFLCLAIIGSFGIYKVFANQNKEVNMDNKKVLVAYYSHSGNTKAVAEKIQNLTGGDIFEITPKTAYPKDYNAVVEQARKEKSDNVFPELADNGNVKDYDIIFLGTPVWWYTMAGPVRTFLKENDFTGKVIAPFCTHGGGGESSTYIDVQKLAPNAKILNGYTSYENSAKDNDIKIWINELKF